MLVDSSSNGEDIGIKNDVLRIEFNGIHEHPIRAFAYLNFTFKAVGLTGFIESHYDHSRTVALDQFGSFYKFGIAVF